jgi:integrase
VGLTIKSNSVAATSFGVQKLAKIHGRPRWGDIQINQIYHLDLQDWIQGPLSKRLKNKTIRDIISNVRQVFRLYRTRKKVAHDPMRDCSYVYPIQRHQIRSLGRRSNNP